MDVPYRYANLGYQQVTAGTAAAGTALTVPIGARLALVYGGGTVSRWRDDGTNPTAEKGIPLAVDGVLRYEGELSRIKFIGEGGTATLNVAYYG